MPTQISIGAYRRRGMLPVSPQPEYTPHRGALARPSPSLVRLHLRQSKGGATPGYCAIMRRRLCFEVPIGFTHPFSCYPGLQPPG